MPGRRDARRIVLQMLYLIDQNSDADLRRIRKTFLDEFPQEALQEFSWSLFIGVREDVAELDKMIRETASNWRIERMAPTDRNILRMGIYEMRKMGTPAPVVLNEAIEIAREFGTENSAAFVNGILDKLKL
ncbi:MAG: transcription antitermination factor NusB [Planctomyces sp.]|nr:transcription antitermination factor NusB [Planctomyces sp.]